MVCIEKVDVLLKYSAVAGCASAIGLLCGHGLVSPWQFRVLDLQVATIHIPPQIRDASPCVAKIDHEPRYRSVRAHMPLYSMHEAWQRCLFTERNAGFLSYTAVNLSPC